MSSAPLTAKRLAAARRGRCTHIVSLLSCVSARPGETIWIFEGKDVKYYGAKISSLLGERPKAVVTAGGKRKALELLQYVESNEDFSSIRFACFVDRDFDCIHPSSENLYVTPSYSIENLYATETAFEAILQGCFELHSHEHEGEIKRLSRIFRKWRNRFRESVRKLNAWISLQKSKPNYSLNLNSVKIDKLIKTSFSAGDFSFNPIYSIDTLKNTFPSAAPITKKQLASEVREKFHRQVSLESLRGKYMTDFMYIVLSALITDAQKPRPVVFRTQRTVTLRVSKINIISDLCAYADTPPCLRRFISKYY